MGIILMFLAKRNSQLRYTLRFDIFFTFLGGKMRVYAPVFRGRYALNGGGQARGSCDYW